MNLMLEEENIAPNHKISTVAKEKNDQLPIVKIENSNDDLGNILPQARTIQSVFSIEIDDSDDEGSTTSSTRSVPITLKSRGNSLGPSIDERPFDRAVITQIKRGEASNAEGIK